MFFVYISLLSLYDHDVELPNFTFYGGRVHKATIFSFFFLNQMIGQFIQENINRGLPWRRRVKGTKSVRFTAYSTHGQLKPRVILAEELGLGLSRSRLTLDVKCSLMHSIVVRDFAEEVNKCCACSLFNCILDLHSRETRAAVAGK